VWRSCGDSPPHMPAAMCAKRISCLHPPHPHTPPLWRVDRDWGFLDPRPGRTARRVHTPSHPPVPHIISHDSSDERTQPHTAPHPEPSRGSARGSCLSHPQRASVTYRACASRRTSTSTVVCVGVVHVAALRGRAVKGRVGCGARHLAERGGCWRCRAVCGWHSITCYIQLRG